jgi:hypothetical protein
MSTKIIKSTLAILGIPIFKWTTEIDEVPSPTQGKAFFQTTERPKHFKDPYSSPWSLESSVPPLER